MIKQQLQREKEKEAEDAKLPVEFEEKMDTEEYKWGISREVTLDPQGLLNHDGSISIQIASDVHTEFYREDEEIPDDLIVPSAPILALLGDIGNPLMANYADFLFKQAER